MKVKPEHIYLVAVYGYCIWLCKDLFVHVGRKAKTDILNEIMKHKNKAEKRRIKKLVKKHGPEKAWDILVDEMMEEAEDILEYGTLPV